MSDPIFIRTSERKSFKRCPQKWQWAWREGLRATGHKADALWFGSGIHLALAERYKYRGTKRGKNVLGVWRDYIRDEVAFVRTLPQGVADDEPKWIDAGKLGEVMLGGYLDKYGKDERWYFIATEQTFDFPLSKRLHYVGTFDGAAVDLASENKDVWLFEHKTAKTVVTTHLSLDDQAGGYWAVASTVLADQKLIPAKKELTGILYNFLRKAEPPDKPHDAEGYYLNKDGSRSKLQPAPFFVREQVWRTQHERARQLQHVRDEAKVMRAMRRGELPIFKNPTRDCSWDCEFFNMCELDESGDAADYEQFKEMTFRKQDPYAAHRKSAAE